MDDSRVFGERLSTPPERQLAGVITKITLENFMCHSSLHIEFGEWVNFITGQNGSGKSAILTALCVAFGSRARGTQRASTLKDFIKTGCSHAVVNVEIRNQGEDAFKPEIYGDVIIIERKISESTSSTILKDRQGRRVASRREELLELIEHFNIDVENPCVIMTQDKSREFLHSGNDKEKFKFYFKATLLQQVSDLLNSINNQLNDANAQVDELEASIRPIMKELNELKVKIKSMEHVEEISLQVQQLKKKLAWSWVYDVDKRIHEQANMIEKLKERIPICQRRIERQLDKMEELKKLLIQKRTQIASMMEKTSEVRRMKDELHQNLSMATKEKLELEETHKRKVNQLQKMVKRMRRLEDQINEIQEQHIKNTQAEESEIMEQLKGLQKEVDAATSCLTRLKDEESALSEEQSMTMNTLNQIAREIEDGERKYREISSHIRDLKQHSTNKMTAFGGERVLSLIREIERHHKKFDMPPIGPIGAHVTLVNGGDVWAFAVEHAIGRLLNAFIVTNHKDSRLLRGCAKEAKYHFVQIIIHDFSRQRLDIPRHMLPQTSHPTILSVLHSDNPTVMNVLVDMGHAERQVLVTDYEVGKSVAFDQRIPNLKEVYTLEGCKMFSRGSVQTILPPNKKIRSGRLCGSLDDQIKNFEEEELKMQDMVRQVRGRKRNVEEILRDLKGKLQSVKKRRVDAEKDLSSKQFTYRDLESSHAAETSTSPTSNVDELRQEIMKVQNEIGEHEMLLENFQVRVKEAEIKANDLKVSFENLCDSAKDDINAFEDAEEELKVIENELSSVESEKDHYEGLMQNKVLSDIKEAEALYQELQINRQESSRKASVICPESEIEALGDCIGTTPEQLSAQLNRLNQRLQQESQRYSGSLDDLRVLYEKKERKILRKQQTYAAFREKLNSCTNALQLRMEKHAASRNFTRKTLSLKFNALLGKKGISGSIKVDYEEKTLSLEVKMPQDSSSNTVRDTKALSGGERSFSTLCFALALHGMTEAPFRAMDEFDVFMDAISRKISLDTLVDFALDQGSQWIFITPHDISMVKPGDRVKKQQMAAPRS